MKNVCLSSGIPVNNILADETLQNEELGKKKSLVENGAKKFHEAFKNTAKSETVQKNNKQRIGQFISKQWTSCKL